MPTNAGRVASDPGGGNGTILDEARCWWGVVEGIGRALGLTGKADAVAKACRGSRCGDCSAIVFGIAIGAANLGVSVFVGGSCELSLGPIEAPVSAGRMSTGIASGVRTPGKRRAAASSTPAALILERFSDRRRVESEIRTRRLASECIRWPSPSAVSN